MISNGLVNFTVLLRGDSVKQLTLEGGSLFLLDDVLVQVATSDAAMIGIPKARGVDLLKGHMQWEAAYAARAHGWSKLSPGGNPIDMGLGRIPTMVWGFDAPAPFEIIDEKINRMLYVTAAIDDVILVMAAPMRAKDEPATVARVIKRSMTTLKVNTGPTDPSRVAREVQAKAGRWQGCVTSP